MTLRPYRRWLHTVTGLLLSVFLVLPAGAQTTAPTAATPTGKPVPPLVRAKLQKIEKESPRYDEPAEALEYLRRRVAPAGQKDVPVERYLQAIGQMETMPRYSAAKQAVLPSRAALESQGISSATDASSLGAWSSLGPGNIGGRTRALVIHPQNPQVMYAAGVAGGVWKTTNGGASWVPLSDFLANIAVNSLAMEKGSPDILYAGTGEGFYNGDAIRGNGVFKTTDGGATWTQLANTTGPNFHYVNKIVASAQGRVYAATRTGLWRSLNGGTSWTRVLNPQVFGGCLDLAIRTDKTADVVFASCGTFEQATVYRNTAAQAAGSIWRRVLRDPGMGRTTLAIAPSNQNVIYALASSNVEGDYLDGLHAVFRSTDGGATWRARVRNTTSRKLDTLLLSNPIIAYLRECQFGSDGAFFNQGWYDNVIAVDPKDPNRVWAGGVDLFRSDDGGRTWGLASYWWAQLTDGSYLPTYAHADQHVIVFHPRYNGTTNRTMFVGNDGGVFKTRNARAATARNTAGVCDPGVGKFSWEGLNNGYGVTQFYHGLPYPDGSTYFGGTQDNGTIRGNDADGADDWAEIFGGDGGFVAVDPTDTDVLYMSTPGLALRKSVDGGQSFALKIDGIDESPGNFLFVTPYVMDPSNPDRLWIGGSQLWRTNDAAESWSAASDVVAGIDFPIVSAIAVSPTDSNRVLAGTLEGFVLRNTSALSTTGSTAWPSSRPRPGYVSWVAFDPENPSIVYATYATFGGGAHVWKSTDGGATWSALGGTGAGVLPDVPVNTIAIDPENTSHLYIGTDVGVFSSIDGGQTWMVENTGFANAPAWALAIQTGPGGARTLFAFTHGRGVWRTPLP